MGKFYETTSTFNYAWDQIVKAFWRRYPNPFNSNILSEDTLAREIRGDQLYSRRLLTKTYRLPKWGQRLVKSNTVPIVEESYINPVEKSMTTYTRNIGFTRLLSVVEKVIYSPDPSDSQKTIVARSAWVSSSVYGIRRAVEKLGVENFRKNCIRTGQGFHYILNRLYPGEGSSEAGATATKGNKEVPMRRLFSKFSASIFASADDPKSP